MSRASRGSIAHSARRRRGLAVACFMCVLQLGLKADLSDFEQGTNAYGSGRSIGGVYSCTPRSIWLPQLHTLVCTCDTEFTMSMYFARYVATVIGMSGGNGGLHIPNVYVNSPDSVRNNHGIPIRDPPTPREIPPRLPPEPKPSPPLESRSVTPRQLTTSTHPRSNMKV